MKLLHDPGIGRLGVTPGTVEWAQRIRLDIQCRMDQIPHAPESVKLLVDAVIRHRGWTLMNKPDGSFFGSFEEFCAFRKPWGLGRSWDALRRVLEVALGKRGLDLAVVAPDGRQENGENRDLEAARFAVKGAAKVSGNTDSGHDVSNRSAMTLTASVTDSRRRAPNRSVDAEARRAKRLRAILRAPAAAQDLYREGFIGQDEAARLGPKDMPPENAATLHEVAQAAVELARNASGPKIEIQRRVSAFVRERLGRPEREERRARLARLVDRLDREDLNWLTAYVSTKASSTEGP